MRTGIVSVLAQSLMFTAGLGQMPRAQSMFNKCEMETGSPLLRALHFGKLYDKVTWLLKATETQMVENSTLGIEEMFLDAGLCLSEIILVSFLFSLFLRRGEAFIWFCQDGVMKRTRVCCWKEELRPHLYSSFTVHQWASYFNSASPCSSYEK